jgi:hypothetical protein
MQRRNEVYPNVTAIPEQHHEHPFVRFVESEQFISVFVRRPSCHVVPVALPSARRNAEQQQQPYITQQIVNT